MAASDYRLLVRVTLNGEPREVRDAISVAELVDELGFSQRRIAVEVNRDVVPRDLYGKQSLCEGDTVEIVHFIGGG